jgi:hypothetical protein
LAITFFSEVTPLPKPPRLSAEEHIRQALWCARQAHVLACRADCPYMRRAAEYLDKVLSRLGSEWGAFYCAGSNCPTMARRYGNNPGGDRALDRLTLEALSYALNTVWDIRFKRWPGQDASRAARNGAWVTARVQGIDGAIGFCLALAERLGLKA